MGRLRIKIFYIISIVFLVLFAAPAVLTAETGTSQLQASHPPGSYPHDIRLELSAESPDIDVFYQFTDHGTLAPPVPYRVPLELSAIPGEERKYTIKIKTTFNGLTVSEKTVIYDIDKRVPLSPAFSLEPGHYIATQYLSFDTDPDNVVFYKLRNGRTTSEDFEIWNGISLILPESPGKPINYQIEAYSVDEAGNQSRISTGNYTIGSAGTMQNESGFSIISPVPGVFANPQPVIIESSNVFQIRCTIDGSEKTEVIYSGPFTPVSTGTVILSVTAEVIDSETGNRSTISREVAYEIIDVPILSEIAATFPKSGTYTNSLVITPYPGEAELSYTFEERPVSEFDLGLESSLNIDPIHGFKKTLTVRLGLQNGGAETGELRFVYILDGRVPEKPEIVIPEGRPLSGADIITITAGKKSEVYFTLDGAEPTADSYHYDAPFSFKSFEIGGVEEVELKTVSIHENGGRSPVTGRTIQTDFTDPSIPKSLLVREGLPGTMEIRLSGDDESSFVFEMSANGETPIDPHLNSPKTDKNVYLSIPFGMEGTFKLKFAAVDPAGNISLPGEILTIPMDRIPPEPPSVSFSENIVTIDGEGDIYYKLSEDPFLQIISSGVYQKYPGPVTMEGIEKARTFYIIHAYTVDENGNQSDISIPEIIRLDRRKPLPPTISFPEPAGIYNLETIPIEIPKAEPDLFIYYTFSNDGSEPPDPDTTSQLIQSTVKFTGTPGEEIVYRIKFLPVYPFSAQDGDISELSFTIDLKNPALPAVSGFENEGLYNTSVRTYLTPLSKSDTVFYSYSFDKENIPDPLGPEGFTYTAPVDFNVGPGREETIYILTGSMDRAGNRIKSETPISFSIDRKIPPKPVLNTSINGILTNKPVEIRFESTAENGAKARIFYEISKNGTVPQIPSTESPLYSEPFFIRGEEGKLTQYSLLACSIDHVGNYSDITALNDFTIDRTVPPVPDNPSIDILQSEVSISWEKNANYLLYYRIQQDQTNSGNNFSLYEKPFNIPIVHVMEGLLIDYYQQSRAGNSSEIEHTAVKAPLQMTKPDLAGVENGTTYSRDITLVNRSTRGKVRYEIGIDPEPPGEVTLFSPAAGKELQFSALQGETIGYSVAVRTFDETGFDLPSETVSLHFQIDKTPPPPPDIAGIADGGYYQEARNITFAAKEGDVFYQIIESSEEQADIASNFIPYRDPITLTGGSGSLQSYEIMAYTVDNVGNRSTKTGTWHITVDQEVIYVSAGAGAGGEGSRDRPFQSLQEAVSYSASSNRGTILLATGTYPIDAMIEPTRSIKIFGGFSAGDWGRGRGKSIVVVNGVSPGDEYAIRVDHIDLSMKDINISCSTDFNGVVFGVVSGQLNLDSAVFSDLEGARPISQSGGDLFLSSTVITAGHLSSDYLIDSRSGAVSIADTSISLDSGKNTSLLYFESLDRFSIKDSIIRAGTGTNMTAITLESSKGEIISCQVECEQSTGTSSIIKVNNSELELKNTLLLTNPDTKISKGMLITNSIVEAEQNIFMTGSAYGATSVIARDSSLKFLRNRFSSTSSSDFLYHFDLSGSKGVFSTNIITTEGSTDQIAVLIRDSSTEWYHNTMVLGKNRGINTSFQIQGDSPTIVINNVIMSENLPYSGTAFSVKNISDKIVIKSNNISGWEAPLEYGGYNVTASGGSISENRSLDKSLLPFVSNVEYEGNITEITFNTFKARGKNDFSLLPSSRCINSGSDLSDIPSVSYDWDGQTRPYQPSEYKGTFDIGADEYYP
jgi:hypothetical protein